MPLSKAINPEMMDLPKTGKLASYPKSGPKSACVDRFKLHSLPKDAQAKREGQFTAKVDFMDNKSSFGQKQESSRIKSAPSFSVGGPEGPGPDRNRFQVHSMPKETVKKLHGLETLKVGFMDAKSTVGSKTPVSNIKNKPAYTFGGGNPMGPRERFKCVLRSDCGLTRSLLFRCMMYIGMILLTRKSWRGCMATAPLRPSITLHNNLVSERIGFCRLITRCLLTQSASQVDWTRGAIVLHTIHYQRRR